MDKAILQIKLASSIILAGLIYCVYNSRFNIQILHITHSLYVRVFIILTINSNFSPNNLFVLYNGGILGSLYSVQ
jgi:hypothetical protein